MCGFKRRRWRAAAVAMPLQSDKIETRGAKQLADGGSNDHDQTTML